MDRREWQISLANELLGKLKHTGALVGGGAPRDWYQGNCAKDIDIWVPDNYTIKQVERLLGMEFEEVSDRYQGSLPFKAYSSWHGDQEVQVMLVAKKNMLEHIFSFPANLSQIAWDGKEYLFTEKFHLGVNYRVCICERGGESLFDKYADKLPYRDWYLVHRPHTRRSVWKKWFLQGVTALNERQRQLSRLELENPWGIDF